MLRNVFLITIPAIIAALAVPTFSFCSKGCNCSENVAVCDTLNLESFGDHIISHLKISHPKVPLILKGHLFKVEGLENVNSISIENATILEIDKSVFTDIPLLSSFNIINSNIPSISNPLAFVNATNLKNLRINNSTLKKFDSIKSYSLEELDLAGCDLSTVSENTFANLPNLTYINLANNKISKISPLAFSKLILLEEINLSNNDISSLDQDMFQTNTELVILNLSYNPLKTFDINYISNIENLVLKSCQLERFNEKLSSDLVLINHLDLSHNKINLSRDSFDKMIDLEYIDLSNNGLKSLDPHIFRSNSRLQKIILDNNNFPKLPKFVCRDGNFETYHFSCKNCSLTTLSVDTFQNFPALVALDLSHNNLNGVNLTIIQYLSSLIELNLSYNQISIINPSSFLKSSALKKLNLANNPLVSLDSNLFLNNQAIKQLDLHNCGLRQLWKQPTTRNITSLLHLNIANNSFSTISPLDLLVTPSLAVLDVSNNPLQCDQILRDTITWLTEHKVSPAFATEIWKTHESMNSVIPDEIEYASNGAPSWRFLAKDRCSEEFYASTLENTKEEIEEPVPPKKNIVDMITSVKDKPVNNDLDDYYDDDFYDSEYSDEDASKSNELDDNFINLKEKDDEFTEDDARIDLEERVFESTLFRKPTHHSRYSFLWPTLVFIFTALSVLVIAANVMLLMLRSRMIPRHMNLPHIKIPQWSTTGKLKKHSGSVYQPLSEDRSGSYTPIITRKEYVPTHNNTPKSVV